MSATGDPTGADLREAGVHGLRWAAMARVAVEAVLLVSMVVLARLISPAEFGYFAVAIIVQELALVITAEGVGTALVQRATVDREHLQAGLWLGLVVGLVLGLLTLVAASLIVVPVFGARTAELVRLATPLFLICAAGTVPMALLRRRLEFRRLSTIDVGHLGRARCRLAGAGHRRAAERGARPGRDRRRRDDDGDGLDLRARADAAAAAQGGARAHELRAARLGRLDELGGLSQLRLRDRQRAPRSRSGRLLLPRLHAGRRVREEDQHRHGPSRAAGARARGRRDVRAARADGAHAGHPHLPDARGAHHHRPRARALAVRRRVGARGAADADPGRRAAPRPS